MTVASGEEAVFFIPETGVDTPEVEERTVRTVARRLLDVAAVPANFSAVRRARREPIAAIAQALGLLAEAVESDRSGHLSRDPGSMQKRLVVASRRGRM